MPSYFTDNEQFMTRDERDFYHMLEHWPDVANYPVAAQERALGHWRDCMDRLAQRIAEIMTAAVIIREPQPDRVAVFDDIAEAHFAHDGCTDEPAHEATERTVADMLADWGLDDEEAAALFED